MLANRTLTHFGLLIQRTAFFFNKHHNVSFTSHT